MWQFHFLLKKPAAAALNYCIALSSKLHRRRKDGTLTSYCEMVIFVLEIYAPDYVIIEWGVEILSFTQLSNMTQSEYAGALRNKALCCNRVYDESLCKGIFIQRIDGYMRHIMRLYWRSNKNIAVHDPCHRATSLKNLQHVWRALNTAYTTTKPNYSSGNKNGWRSSQK